MSTLIVKVVRIGTIEHHPNADRLDIATIDGMGWICVVGRDQFSPGDRAVYIPVDAVLPADLIYRLGISQHMKKGDWIRTVKLRGVISQGLLMPLTDDEFYGADYDVGADVADIYGITKYEPPENPTLAGIARSPHPNFHKYTNIERIQNYMRVIEPQTSVCITEKIHGTNFRMAWLKPNDERDTECQNPECKAQIPFSESEDYWHPCPKCGDDGIVMNGDGYVFFVGSHNVNLRPEKRNFYWKVAEYFDFFNNLPHDRVCYGEIYGYGVQDLTYGAQENEQNVRFFDVFNVEKGCYEDWETVEAFSRTIAGESVPTLYEGPWDVSLLDEYTDGKTTLMPEKSSHVREGIVIRPLAESWNRQGGRVIFKSISRNYERRKAKKDKSGKKVEPTEHH